MRIHEIDKQEKGAVSELLNPLQRNSLDVGCASIRNRVCKKMGTIYEFKPQGKRHEDRFESPRRLVKPELESLIEAKGWGYKGEPSVVMPESSRPRVSNAFLNRRKNRVMSSPVGS